MKTVLLLFMTALAGLLSSCATPELRPAFHNQDNSALIVTAYDNGNSQVIAPTASAQQKSQFVLDQARSLDRHQTAVIILENYSEAKLGPEFRARTFPWFLGLRCLGYQHIFFLQGNGAPNPDSLPTLFEYD